MHAQSLGDHAKLHTDIAVANDAQLFSSDFKGVGGCFLPLAAVGRRILAGYTTQQKDRLGEHQLGHAACVGKGRIEHGNSTAGSGVKFNLVGAYAKAAYGHEFFGSVEHLLGELCARPNPHEVSIGDSDLELFQGQCLLVLFDVAVPRLLQCCTCGRVHALK